MSFQNLKSFDRELARLNALADSEDASFGEQLKAEQEREQKAREFANKQRDIERLGGLRAYIQFTADSYDNKNIIERLSQFPKQDYFVWGTTGSGKTHAAIAVSRNDYYAQLVRMADIAREIRACEHALEEKAIIDKYAAMPMVLDDLGSEKITEFVQNILYEIIDKRWRNMTTGLIITSNYDLKQLTNIVGDRIVSRIIGLVGSNVIHLTSPDGRRNTK